jgi:sugar diacid utilization regulator
MQLTTTFASAEITSAFDWQLSQEVNVIDNDGEIIAKAEIEIITLNKHRGAKQSYQLLEQHETDWELPLNLYFSGHNLNEKLCNNLHIKPNPKKAQQHIMIEALSVLTEHRNKGVAMFLLQAIANEYQKAQSITVMSMPMRLFVDSENCQTDNAKRYYQALQLDQDLTSGQDLQQFFIKAGFVEFEVDSSLLAEPLSFDVFVTSPEKLTKLNHSN